MHLRTFLIAAGAALSSLPVGAADGSSVPTTPIQAFFSVPDFSDPILSPDGKSIAALMRSDKGRQMLAVFDIDDPSKLVIAAVFDDADVDAVQWADGRRLVFSLREGRDPTLGNHGSGLFAVDRDGKDPRALIMMRDQFFSVQGTLTQTRSLTSDHELVRTLDDGTGDVIVQRVAHKGLTRGDRWRIDGTTPLRLDTRTGRTTEIAGGEAPAQAMLWSIDNHGVARAAQVQETAGTAVFVPDGHGPWRRLLALSASPVAPAPQDFDRVGVDGAAYFARVADGPEGVRTLDRLALGANPVTAPVVSVRGFDFEGELIEDAGHGRVLGIRYVSDAAGTVWLDAAMKDIQAKVDAKLPGMVNQLQVARCGCASRVLVSSRSDHDPGRFALYDPVKDALTPLSRARAAIDPRAMANTDFYRVKARDGGDLPIYVTTPHGKGPWPTVVLVHDGPWLRGSRWQWDDEAQFLASRGYLVVKPEYRGTDGYGHTHLEAGFGQWGGKIQDDLVDAVRWASAKGLADASRACIAGAQFGGYAAVMALAHDPGVFRCAAGRSILADMDDVVRVVWSDTSDAMRVHGLAALIGDPERDAAALAAASPVRVANRVQGAVLLVHGAEDRRAPIVSAGRLQRALQAAKVPVEWVEVPGETQGFGIPDSRFTYYAHLEAFLAARIGPSASASQP